MFRLLTGEFPYRNPVEDRNRSSIIQEIRDGLTVVPSSRRGDLDGRIDAHLPQGHRAGAGAGDTTR